MATKGMSSGVQQIAGAKTAPASKQIELCEKSWRDLRNKLDSMLIGNNIIKGDHARKMCQELDLLSTDERLAHITKNWGPNFANKANTLLPQLEVLEKEIARLKSAD